MEQQMNNGMSQKEACQNWGIRFSFRSLPKAGADSGTKFYKGF